MKGSRWTEEEDQILAKVVLQKVRNGGTQLDAFAEVGKKLHRTPGSCAFRWNAVVRKKEIKSFKQAKQERIERHLKARKIVTIDTFQEVVQLLKQQESFYNEIKEKVKNLMEQLQVKEQEYQRLLEENKQLNRLVVLTPSKYTKELMKQYDELLNLLEQTNDPEPKQLASQSKISSSSME